MSKKTAKRPLPKASKVADAAPSKTQSQRESVIREIGDGGNDKHLYKDGQK